MVKAFSEELYYLLKKSVNLDEIRLCVEICERCIAMPIRGLAGAEGAIAKDEGHLGYIQIANIRP